jgi:hypothetical protein
MLWPKTERCIEYCIRGVRYELVNDDVSVHATPCPSRFPVLTHHFRLLHSMRPHLRWRTDNKQNMAFDGDV